MNRAVVPDEELERRFRAVAGAFPAAVAVVAARDQHGAPHGMTASSFLSVSLRPLLVLVSVATGARLHGLLTAQPRYSVSLLANEHVRLARQFSGQVSSRPEVEWREVDDVPVLAAAAAWMTAETIDPHSAGDHTLFIARVLSLDLAPGRTPLAYRSGRFGRVHVDEHAWAPDPWGGSLQRAWG